jgi:hypothetical protein
MFHVATPLGYPEYQNQGPTDMSLLNHSQKRSTNPPSMRSVAYQEYILRAEGRVVLREYIPRAKGCDTSVGATVQTPHASRRLNLNQIGRPS